jgi:uncharacterized protein
MSEKPWWETTKLEDMDEAQWESVCDRCGRCCLIKAWQNGEVVQTKVACRLMDIKTACCIDYTHRQNKVPDCIKLAPSNVGHPLLPRTCAYLLIHEGKPLEWWHPLVSGDPETVKQAGISIIGDIKYTERTISLAKMAIFQALEQAIP